MCTKELIEELRDTCLYEDVPGSTFKEEIIQKLREYDELKKMITDVIDPLIEVYEFLLAPRRSSSALADLEE